MKLASLKPTWDNAKEPYCPEFAMVNAQGFGTPRTRKTKSVKRQEVPPLDLETRIQLWQAGLLHLQLPKGMKPRSLTEAEQHWISQVAAAEYIAPGSHGQQALFYTAPPPEFRLEAADWYLHPDWYWDQAPVRLQDIMQQFPATLFALSASGQPPAFYPDRTSDYTDAQEAIMRSIFREMTRIGWSLPQYKWFVMQQFRKTTAQLTGDEAIQVLAQLQPMESA